MSYDHAGSSYEDDRRGRDVDENELEEQIYRRVYQQYLIESLDPPVRPMETVGQHEIHIDENGHVFVVMDPDSADFEQTFIHMPGLVDDILGRDRDFADDASRAHSPFQSPAYDSYQLRYFDGRSGLPTRGLGIASRARNADRSTTDHESPARRPITRRSPYGGSWGSPPQRGDVGIPEAAILGITPYDRIVWDGISNPEFYERTHREIVQHRLTSAINNFDFEDSEADETDMSAFFVNANGEPCRTFAECLIDAAGWIDGCNQVCDLNDDYAFLDPDGNIRFTEEEDEDISNSDDRDNGDDSDADHLAEWSPTPASLNRVTDRSLHLEEQDGIRHQAISDNRGNMRHRDPYDNENDEYGLNVDDDDELDDVESVFIGQPDGRFVVQESGRSLSRFGYRSDYYGTRRLQTSPSTHAKRTHAIHRRPDGDVIGR
eukprot:jgi/Hompol1/4087/HPOL_003499-RA